MPAHSFTAEEAAPLVWFANERHWIYIQKTLREGGSIPAWANPLKIIRAKANFDGLTTDPILGRFRFCNVFRELDRVTVWIREHIREPFADHEHLWFMLAAARFINWPPTLAFLIADKGAWPDDNDFQPGLMGFAMERWKAEGNKVETGAYMIRAESDPKKEWYSWSKQRYVAEVVLGRAWRDRELIRLVFNERPSLQEAWELFRRANDPKVGGWVGWGPFMCGQVVADLRHTRYLRDAPDAGRWAPIGPGSMRGLNRLSGRPLKQMIKQEQALDEMLQLQALLNDATGPHVPPIELHDVQNCLCETDKYLRVRNGEGEPRAAYVPGRGY